MSSQIASAERSAASSRPCQLAASKEGQRPSGHPGSASCVMKIHSAVTKQKRAPKRASCEGIGERFDASVGWSMCTGRPVRKTLERASSGGTCPSSEKASKLDAMMARGPKAALKASGMSARINTIVPAIRKPAAIVCSRRSSLPRRSGSRWMYAGGAKKPSGSPKRMTRAPTAESAPSSSQRAARQPPTKMGQPEPLLSPSIQPGRSRQCASSSRVR